MNLSRGVKKDLSIETFDSTSDSETELVICEVNAKPEFTLARIEKGIYYY
ncbi:hypothetical protein [Nitrososphaera viennensis]|uniref:Uncharacterized protein n=1 Tax=Nitrososphaera viennensis TaxID=1034015 RepID=A0A977IFF5_9ARCH|nr:hypothetical protein [Nitrososphaera viennensis]UVS69761.1 hypothetical protein NWT39_02995 [Nitrososphaera viennensis]